MLILSTLMGARYRLAMASVSIILVLLSSSLAPGAVSSPNIQYQSQLGSLNWSGYVAADDLDNPSASVTSVSASWTVPTVVKPPGTGFSVIFIGIGGFFLGDNTLIQVGTAQFVVGGVAVYFPWLELLPGPLENISLLSGVTISPVETVTSSIAEVSNTNCTPAPISPQTCWKITFDKASTTGVDFQTFRAYASSKKSAEWIVERPSICIASCRLTQLANYGSVTFTDAHATISGATEELSELDNNTITMFQGRSGASIVLSIVTVPVDDDGDEFIVTYKP